MRIWTRTTWPNTTAVTRMPDLALRLPPAAPDGAATGRNLLAGATTRDQRGLGGALPEPVVATGTAQPTQGAGEESRAGAGKRSGRSGPFTIASTVWYSAN
jgi:hypothetical protein